MNTGSDKKVGSNDDVSLPSDDKKTHVPGPWFVGGPYPSVSVIVQIPGDPEGPPDYAPICILDERQSGKPSAETLATARLIAAAPDLLEACKRIAGYGDTFAYRTDEVNPYEQLCAAIAKAEGRS